MKYLFKPQDTAVIARYVNYPINSEFSSYLLFKSHHVHGVTHLSIFHTPGLHYVFLPKPAIQITDKNKNM